MMIEYQIVEIKDEAGAGAGALHSYQPRICATLNFLAGQFESHD